MEAFIKLFLFPCRGVKSIRAPSLDDAVRQYEELLTKDKVQIKLLRNEGDIKAFTDAYTKPVSGFPAE